MLELNGSSGNLPLVAVAMTRLALMVINKKSRKTKAAIGTRYDDEVVHSFESFKDTPRTAARELAWLATNEVANHTPATGRPVWFQC